MSLFLGIRSGEGEVRARKEEALYKMNLSCLWAAVEEVAWSEWPFAPLVGGMSPGMADWWQSLAQPNG